MPFKHWQACSIHHIFRKPIPVFHHLLYKEMLATVHFKPSLAQLWTVSMHFSLDPREKTSAPPSPPSRLSLLWKLLGVIKSPISLLISKKPEVLSLSSQLCCPPLGLFKDLHIFLQLWGPELHTKCCSVNCCSHRLWFDKLSQGGIASCWHQKPTSLPLPLSYVTLHVLPGEKIRHPHQKT